MSKRGDRKYDPELSATQKVNLRQIEDLVGTGKHTFGTVGDYQLKSLLGKGGSAIVYRACKPGSIDMALKVFTKSPAADQTKLGRFLREAQAVSQLREHPNIITVYDVGSDGDCHYIAMELVKEGRTLESVLEEHGKLDRHEALTLAIGIAKGVAYAHSQGFIHRDLKPQNILLSEFGEPLLSDFGLVFAGNSNLTAAGERIGTPVYIAPELLETDSRNVDPQSDIYSLGVMLYRMTTGTLPYGIDHGMPLRDILDRIMNHEPISPAAYGSRLGADLEAIIQKLLEKRPEHRYQTADVVVHELEACRAGKPVRAAIPNLGERFERWIKRNKVSALSVLAAALAVAVAYVHFDEQMEDLRAEQMAAYAEVVNEERGARAERRRLEALLSTDGGEADETGPQRLWREARDLLAEGKLTDAEAKLAAALTAARRDGDLQLAYLCRAATSRCRLARGDYDEAYTDFLAVAASQKRHSFMWELCIFEAGAAAWLKGDQASALRAWEIILPDTPAAVEKAPPDSYISVLCKFLLNKGDAVAVETAMKQVSTAFKALGYWALAQKNNHAPERRELMGLAHSKGRHIFVWIHKED